MAYKINPDVCVSCGVCKENCPVECIKEDGGVKTYFQKNGTVETDYNDYDDGWWETETITVKLTGVMLEEVTISNNHSTPVPGGACLQVKNTTLEFEDSDRTYSWLYDLLELLFGDGWN